MPDLHIFVKNEEEAKKTLEAYAEILSLAAGAEPEK